MKGQVKSKSIFLGNSNLDLQFPVGQEMLNDEDALFIFCKSVI